jgi:heptosyltransferase II
VHVLIELPNWIGDCVMSTPAIENIIKFYKNIDITLMGPNSSIELISNNLKVVGTISTDSKNKFFFNSFSKLGQFDVFFSFRGSLRAKIIKYNLNSIEKYQYNHNKLKSKHQVEKYVEFVNNSLHINFKAGNLTSFLPKPIEKKSIKLFGINPGATYGSSKRWYPEKFAQLAIQLSNSFDILIFGGINELSFANEIEDYLLKNKIYNFKNLAGKTTVTELTYYISNLDIFITGDSGPMHIAASLKIPTIALFGSTNPTETSQWRNNKSIIVSKSLQCQPCMKKTCPLKHHNCMKNIEVSEVLDSINQIIKI